MKIKIKKKNRGKFTKAAKAAGESVQEYAHSVLNNPKATKLQKKRAQFAVNAKKWHHKDGGLLMQNGGQILPRYISLVNAGISPQVAFDTSNLSLVEDNRKNKYYSFGKRATNLQDWTKNVVDSLTVGRYQNLNNTTNFQQFKQGLKQKHYNSRPAFYNIEMNRDRDKNKKIVNQYNQTHGLPLISGLYSINANLA